MIDLGAARTLVHSHARRVDRRRFQHLVDGAPGGPGAVRAERLPQPRRGRRRAGPVGQQPSEKPSLPATAQLAAGTHRLGLDHPWLAGADA